MRIFVWKPKAAGILAGILALCAIGYMIAYPATAGAYQTDRQLPIYCVDTNQKMCSVSFDAAWGNEDTQTLIDILEKYHVKATFFVVGNWAVKYPESVKALADAGEEVMSHSNTHAHFNSLSSEEITDDLSACNEKIEAVTGVCPTLIRCPYGEYDNHVISAIRAMGMEPIQWSVDSLDWKGISAEEITKRVTGKVQPGSIILFHNAAEHTPEALPGILETLISQGYTVVPISQLICHGQCGVDYTIDHTGKQFVAKATPVKEKPAESQPVSSTQD
jgi:polysaccharide deacetylase family sporulation protein PdaB